MADGSGEHDEEAKLPDAPAAARFAEADCFHRQSRRRLGENQCHQEDVHGIENGEHEARNECAFVHVADRFAELIGHYDEHQRRRDDLRQRAGGGDDAACHAPVVTIAQHDRQRDQAHRNDRGRNHAGGGGKQGADKNHGISEAAANRAEQLSDSVEQIFRHPGSFEYQAHEGEERNRQQRVVAHHAVDAIGQGLQKIRLELPELNPDQRKDQADGAERKCRRIPEQQKNDQGAEHDRGHIGDEECFHA